MAMHALAVASGVAIEALDQTAWPSPSRNP
jgi:hypothetical protein